MNCPTRETLQRLELGFLEDPEPVQAHVESCLECAGVMLGFVEDIAVLERAAKRVSIARVAPAKERPLKLFAAGFGSVAATGLLALGIVWIASDHARSPAKPTEDTEDAVACSSPRPTPSFVEEKGEPKKLTSYDAWTLDGRHARSDGHAEESMHCEPTASDRPFRHGSSGTLLGSGSGGRYGNCSEGGRDMFFQNYGVSPEFDTATERLSTFALDVDTASYTLVRNYLKRGELPPPEAVRVEEFVNYFRYADDPPENDTFAVRLEAAPSPFDSERHLLRIALTAKRIPNKDRKDVVLTFVIDVSGSMAQENRLGLVKRSLTFLVDRLRPTDRIAIVVYGSDARHALDSTFVSNREAVIDVIDSLHAGGSTNAEAGLRVGYEVAAGAFDPKCTNRVILCTDGVANNGETVPERLLATVGEHVKKGIYLSALGFGMGNYNDVLIEKLANQGNGNYAYIDGFAEAKKFFSEKLAGMLEVVAADAKVQVEFDPNSVAKFRRLGYENRNLRHQDFRNDKVDAGEVGAGHHVTALYEIALKAGAKGRIATVHLRYREPDTKEVVETQASIGAGQVRTRVTDASPSFRLAVAVAQFAEILRESPRAQKIRLDRVAEETASAVEDLDRPADGVEFLELVAIAAKLKR